MNKSICKIRDSSCIQVNNVEYTFVFLVCLYVIFVRVRMDLNWWVIDSFWGCLSFRSLKAFWSFGPITAVHLLLCFLLFASPKMCADHSLLYSLFSSHHLFVWIPCYVKELSDSLVRPTPHPLPLWLCPHRPSAALSAISQNNYPGVEVAYKTLPQRVCTDADSLTTCNTAFFVRKDAPCSSISLVMHY